ncbi:MAG: redoxin domain-containing protein [Acidimicrobiia bacterium]|nr:redoxin domain-containing protein [Acidimicrobiia bacterium]
MTRSIAIVALAVVAAACGSTDASTQPDDNAPLATTTTSTTVAPTTTTIPTLSEVADEVTITGDSLPQFGDNPDPAVGLVAPTVSGVSFDGSPVTIEPSDKFTVVISLAHWCPYCQEEVDELGPYLTATPLPDNVEVLLVSTFVDETRPNYPPSEWLTPEAWPTTVLIDTVDSTVANAYGFRSVPFWTILDPNGVVLARTAGSLPLEIVEGLFANLAGLSP